MQNSGGPFESPQGLATFVVGGDTPVNEGKMVTIESHRARFGSKVVNNGAKAHRFGESRQMLGQLHVA